MSNKSYTSDKLYGGGDLFSFDGSLDRIIRTTAGQNYHVDFGAHANMKTTNLNGTTLASTSVELFSL